MNKGIKLFNVLFPIWFILFLPPVILATLAGNFIIDSLVIIFCFFVFRLRERARDMAGGTSWKLGTFYQRSIFKVWLFGFLADFIGAAFIFGLSILGDKWGLPNEIISALSFDPFRSVVAVLLILIAMLLSGFFIFLFNYRVTLKNLIQEQHLKFKVALAIAIITLPWTFLIPSKWLYQGY